jgi:hypothetical protein
LSETALHVPQSKMDHVGRSVVNEEFRVISPGERPTDLFFEVCAGDQIFEVEQDIEHRHPKSRLAPEETAESCHQRHMSSQLLSENVGAQVPPGPRVLAAERREDEPIGRRPDQPKVFKKGLER